MNDNHISEQELEKMLLSGEGFLIIKALKYMYQSPHWRLLVQNSIAFPPTLFETHYPKLFASLKAWLPQKGSTERFKKKGLTTIIKGLWREYVITFLKEEETILLQMFQANDSTTSLAMEICYSRFYAKIKATLMNMKTDEDAVKGVMTDTFIKLFEQFKKKGFSFKKNMEAYCMGSCKYAYWSYWDKRKRSIPFEDMSNFKGLEEVKDDTLDIIKEQMECFEKKVLPKMGDACKRILGLAYLGYKNPEIADLLNCKVSYIKRKKSECLTMAKNLGNDLCS